MLVGLVMILSGPDFLFIKYNQYVAIKSSLSLSIADFGFVFNYYSLQNYCDADPFS